MALEALLSLSSTTPCNNDLFNFIFYDTTTTTMSNNDNLFFENTCPEIQDFSGGGGGYSTVVAEGGGGRKKRRRRAKACKNKEEAESQRMTHIAVERNRRKMMNEHLTVLRSLMPESYVQRGDQASIVGGAIEFVKELEHLLQTLEAQKLRQLAGGGATAAERWWSSASSASQIPSKCTAKITAAADIEVTLIETHANVRILSGKRKNLSKMVAGFERVCMCVLHLNVTTFDPLVLYSISAKVEGGCQLNSADEIAEAVHHILKAIEDEQEEVTIP